MVVLTSLLGLIGKGSLIDADVAGAIQVDLDDIVEVEAGRRPAASCVPSLSRCWWD